MSKIRLNTFKKNKNITLYNHVMDNSQNLFDVAYDSLYRTLKDPEPGCDVCDCAPPRLSDHKDDRHHIHRYIKRSALKRKKLSDLKYPCKRYK